MQDVNWFKRVIEPDLKITMSNIIFLKREISGHLIR